MKKIKIAIAGIGGVGGYFGALLAKHYENNDEAEIFFIARGENEKVISENGLKVESTKGNFTAYPAKTTSDADRIGIVDFLICTTKSYHLEQILLQLSPCINTSTVILPLLNGVDSNERIKSIFPDNEVWEGCVYLVSRLAAPGFIKETGNISLLFFGSSNGTKEKLKLAEHIFLNAGLEAKLSENIQQTIWEKFLFISTIATVTSYLDKSIGEVLAHNESKLLLHSLLSELKNVADKKNIVLPENIINKTIEKMIKLPYETTSSMHSDFQKGKQTEVNSLTGYVVESGRQLNVLTPTYNKIYEQLVKKTQANKCLRINLSGSRT